MDRRTFIKSFSAVTIAPYVARAACADAPQSRFGWKSTAEEVTEGIDLSGKTAVITGVNSGIGYETMRVLALRGAHVLGTARTLEKSRQACENVEGGATPLVLFRASCQETGNAPYTRTPNTAHTGARNVAAFGANFGP